MTLTIKFLWYLLLDTVVMLLGMLFAPVVARNVGEDWNIKNPLLKLIYQTPDAYMNGMGFGGLGKGGDKDFYNDNLGKPLVEVAKEWMKRNTAHGYRAWKLGIDYGDEVRLYDPSITTYAVYNQSKEIGYCSRISGNMTFEEHSGEGHYHYRYYNMRGKLLSFMYYRNLYFTLPVLGKKRLRLKLGWDLWPMWWVKGTPRMFVCSIGIHRVKE